MKRFNRNKVYISIISLAVILITGVSTAYSFINTMSNSTINRFTGSSVNIGIVEKGSVHEDSNSNVEIYDTLTKQGQTVDKVVTIQNMGGDSYVRVRLVPVIKNDKGQVVAKNVNLSYSFADNTKWRTNGDNVYYYSEILNAGVTTDVLLKSVTLNETLPTGYHLELQVLSDAIAARPVENLKTAWNITDFTGMTTLN